MAISAETFFLDPSDHGTLQARIQQRVAEGVLSGRLRPGERMPSSRKLAAHLGVSRITVTLAYNELVANDYLRARGRSGYFVSEEAPTPRTVAEPPRPAGRPVDWTRALGHRFSDASRMGKPEDWRRFRYPFVYGQADPSLFDHQNWRLCTLKALGQRDAGALLDDSFERDDPLLVEFLARHTLPRRGVLAGDKEILITLGAQNALWLAAQTLLNQRRAAAVEDPGYPGLRDILRQTRCRLSAVPVGPEGLDPAALPEGLDVVFVTPSHHCPTGATMPMAARRALLDRAAAEDFLIVEDDYEFEMAFARPPFPALKSLDRDGRVIYVGSFSKSLFPGLRLGYVVAAEPVIHEMRALRATVLRHPPGLMQRAAAYFLSLGHYDALIRRLGRAYAHRREVMAAAVAAHGLDMAGAPDAGGSSLWLRAPDPVDTSALALALRQQGVLIEPGAPFFADPTAPRRHYRLAYSSIPAERIPDGVALVAAALREDGQAPNAAPQQPRSAPP
ncbi:MAG: PLP-dependent aminotransferase family protein [Rhodobacteraceae bacterium]|nr:MAG: PLP-dependent aminotransferase family protein [Paracoccaceae bacterium]